MSGRESPLSSEANSKAEVRDHYTTKDVITQEKSSSAETFYDDKATKRLLRKMDLYLIPFLALLYLLSFLDRSNIGNAKLAGLEASLNMKGLQYNNALAIFFPFYVAAEVPSNLMMKLTRPSIWIPSIMVVWGFMCIAMGFVHNYAGLMAARAALGIAEGGLFPGITFYLTMWYRRHECGFRMAIFFSAATAAGAFGGLLARAIMEMDGVRGYRAWQWIFILEGIATVIVAFSAFWAMSDYPATAKFLNEDEKREVVRRLELDQNALDSSFQKKYIFDAFKDWKIWAFCFITVGIFTPLYCISLFLPTIVKSLGYTNNTAQLMTVPPYVFACLTCITGGWLADRYKQRGVFLVSFILLAVIGASMLAATKNDHVKYAGTFFVCAGIYTNVPAITAWCGNNIGGTTKRSVGMAMQVGIGNLGGVMSAYMYLPRDSPHYRNGHGALIGLSSGAALGSIAMSIYLRRENARREAAKPLDSYTEQEKYEQRELGDSATFFRYTV